MPEGVESLRPRRRHLHAGRRIAHRLALHRHIARRPPLRDIHLEAASPWGLWAMRAARPWPAPSASTPTCATAPPPRCFCKTADPGLRLRRQVGKGREFDNLRHYLPGDSFEDIHWKATARRAFPVVKLYRVEHAQEVYAVIDSSRLSARRRTFSTATSTPRCIWRWWPSGRATASAWSRSATGRTASCARAAAWTTSACAAKPSTTCAPSASAPISAKSSPACSSTCGAAALLVFFTSLDDALLAETFEREVPLLARRHLVLVNVTETSAMTPLFAGEPPPDLDSLYGGLAGQMLWNRMRKLQICAPEPRREAFAGDRGTASKPQVTAGVPRCEAEAGAVIIDLARFVAAEKPYWDELERVLRQVEDDPERRLAAAGDPAAALSVRAMVGRPGAPRHLLHRAAPARISGIAGFARL